MGSLTNFLANRKPPGINLDQLNLFEGKPVPTGLALMVPVEQLDEDPDNPRKAFPPEAVPVRQWVLSLPIPLRVLLAAQPELVTPVLQVVHRVITRHLLGQAGLKAEEADSGAVTLIQRFGSAANLNVQPQYPRYASD